MENHSVPRRYTWYSTQKSHQVIQTTLLPPGTKELVIPMLPTDIFLGEQEEQCVMYQESVTNI